MKYENIYGEKHIHIYVHTYIQTYLHTYIHTYIQTPSNNEKINLQEKKKLLIHVDYREDYINEDQGQVHKVHTLDRNHFQYSLLGVTSKLTASF